MHSWKHILMAALAVSSLGLQPIGMGLFQCVGCCSAESEASCCQAPAKPDCCSLDESCCDSATASCCRETKTKRSTDCRCGSPGKSLPELPLPDSNTSESRLELFAAAAPIVWQMQVLRTARIKFENSTSARTSKVSKQTLLCVWRA